MRTGPSEGEASRFKLLSPETVVEQQRQAKLARQKLEARMGGSEFVDAVPAGYFTGTPTHEHIFQGQEEDPWWDNDGDGEIDGELGVLLDTMHPSVKAFAENEVDVAVGSRRPLDRWLAQSTRPLRRQMTLTGDELVGIVKNAMRNFGEVSRLNSLWQQIQQQNQDDDIGSGGEEESSEIKIIRRGGERMVLRCAYEEFCQLQVSRQGHNNHLTRLKMQKGCGVLLRLDMSFDQFDCMFRISNRDAAGEVSRDAHVDFDEFYNAFATQSAEKQRETHMQVTA
jgi:hypothetical protein